MKVTTASMSKTTGQLSGGLHWEQLEAALCRRALQRTGTSCCFLCSTSPFVFAIKNKEKNYWVFATRSLRRVFVNARLYYFIKNKEKNWVFATRSLRRVFVNALLYYFIFQSHKWIRTGALSGRGTRTAELLITRPDNALCSNSVQAEASGCGRHGRKGGQWNFYHCLHPNLKLKVEGWGVLVSVVLAGGYNLVVGPCSIHDVEAALDYARRLKVLADEFQMALAAS